MIRPRRPAPANAPAAKRLVGLKERSRGPPSGGGKQSAWNGVAPISYTRGVPCLKGSYEIAKGKWTSPEMKRTPEMGPSRMCSRMLFSSISGPEIPSGLPSAQPSYPVSSGRGHPVG